MTLSVLFMSLTRTTNIGPGFESFLRDIGAGTSVTMQLNDKDNALLVLNPETCKLNLV